uniref:Large ribosomal subunit protein uL18 n=1 Tax=uncultured Chloroflexi bacterium Rifle_16ft_4_minimus_450 TaxID=1665075 RepID=A0A0H4TBI6_9CHLR|nr:50S ribosomal protein L18, large subunit ribosomal protein L18 [uncultured Chloroflexi bacterium Rifle_16ft_4_minimus_450]
MAKKTREDMRRHRHQRVRKKVAGSVGRPRLNVYRSLSDIYAQVIDDGAGQTLVSASSLDPEIRPRLTGLSKIEQARLVGTLIAERAKARGVAQVVFDRGGYRYQGRVQALAEAARKAGLEF